MSRFSRGDVSTGTEPEVKHGGGVTNQDSSMELRPASSASPRGYVLTARVSRSAAEGIATAVDVADDARAMGSASTLESSSAQTERGQAGLVFNIHLGISHCNLLR